MMPDLDSYYKEHAEQARQHEDHRERMTNIVLGVAGVLVGLVTFSKLSPWSLPAALAIILLGAFGFLFAGKHYERFRLHTAIMKEIRDEMDLIAANPCGAVPRTLNQLRDDGECEHYDKFEWPKFTGTRSACQATAQCWIARQRTHVFWEAIHVLIALIGIGICATIVVKLAVEKPPTGIEIRILNSSDALDHWNDGRSASNAWERELFH